MKKNNKWKTVIIVLVVLVLVSLIVSWVFSLFAGQDFNVAGGNVALISINGEIVGDRVNGHLGGNGVASKDIVDQIKKAEKDHSIKAIIFEINSGGGSVVASEEIANAISKANKTTVAVIREIGASGAYWAASSTDYIISSRMSIVGSLAVISSYLEFSGLLKDYNITYERIVSGKYKDMGSPFKDLTGEERALFEKKIAKVHEYFVEQVAKNRNIPKQDVEKIATGEFFLGEEAKDLRLIDALGSMDDAVDYISKRQNITVELVSYEKEESIFEILRRLSADQSFLSGKAVGNSLFAEKRVSIVS